MIVEKANDNAASRRNSLLDFFIIFSSIVSRKRRLRQRHSIPDFAFRIKITATVTWIRLGAGPLIAPASRRLFALCGVDKNCRRDAGARKANPQRGVGKHSSRRRELPRGERWRSGGGSGGSQPFARLPARRSAR